MRNNEERIGPMPSVGGEEEVLKPGAGTEQPLSFPSSTEFVELPSKGKYYPVGSSLYGKESIELKFMSAKEEDILTNKSLLKKGLAIDRLLSSLFVNKSILLDDLLVGDKNALLIAARISAYGAEYRTSVVCPQCSQKFEHIFDLNTIKCKELSANLNPDGTCTFVLPKSKANVVCKLLAGRDEKYLSQQVEMKKKHNLVETPLTDQLRSIIFSINGETDKGKINKFIEVLPAFDSRYLRSEYTKIVPDVDTNFTVSCPECDMDSEVTLPMSSEFLWPK